jgi:hypothetical protein
MGALLPLDEKEFDALDMMATRPGQSLPFDQLHRAWCTTDEAARGLVALQRKVNEVGHGFMWISHDPEAGYALGTRWGRNFSAQAA